MVFPVNFIAGAAVGAAVAYVCKDQSAKDWMAGAGKKIKEQTTGMFRSVKDTPSSERVVDSQVEQAAPTQ